MNVTVSVEPGPHVSLVFAGDPLPDRDREALVPIRAERSVDQDLLEDASLRIENALREQGYRAARAPYTREEKGGELVLTFTIARGPLHRVESVETSGNCAHHRRRPRAAAADQARRSVRRRARRPRRRGDHGALPRPRLHAGGGEARTSRCCPRPTRRRRAVSAGRDPIRRSTKGRRRSSRSVEFAGRTRRCEKALRAQMGLDGGRPFYRPQLSVDRDAIERAYRNRGFQSVAVTSQLSFEDDQQFVSITWTIREGEQITVDRVLINGNARTSARPDSPRADDQAGQPDERRRDDREPAAAGRARAVPPRPHHRAAAHRIAARATCSSIWRRPTPRPSTTAAASRSAASARATMTASGAVDRLDVGPRGFFSISRRNLWGKNRSVTLFGRVTLRRASRRRQPRSDRQRRLRLQRLSRPVHVPRAARVRHDRRRAVHGLRRAEPPHQLHLQSQGRHRRLRAPRRRVHADRPLHLRLHEGVRRADRAGRSAADRSPVPAGQAVEGLRRRAARLARRRARSAARRGHRPRHVGGGQGARIRGGLREDVRAGLHLPASARARLRDRGRRAARSCGRLRAERRRRRSRLPAFARATAGRRSTRR